MKQAFLCTLRGLAAIWAITLSIFCLYCVDLSNPAFGESFAKVFESESEWTVIFFISTVVALFALIGFGYILRKTQTEFTADPFAPFAADPDDSLLIICIAIFFAAGGYFAAESYAIALIGFICLALPLMMVNKSSVLMKAFSWIKSGRLDEHNS